MKNYIYFFAAALLISFAACKSTKETSNATQAPKVDCSGTAYTYTTDIKPILTANCNGCHGPQKKRGGLDFTIDEVLMEQARNGKLVCSIHQNKGCAAMPAYNPKLPDATIKQIECWVNSGMPK